MLVLVCLRFFLIYILVHCIPDVLCCSTVYVASFVLKFSFAFYIDSFVYMFFCTIVHFNRFFICTQMFHFIKLGISGPLSIPPFVACDGNQLYILINYFPPKISHLELAIMKGEK